jgi:hypothetical protein
MTSQEQPYDPVLRAVADYWDDIRRYADPGQRERLAALVAGTAEPDADEARAALADELLDILPPGHPVSQLLRATPMYGDELSARSEAQLADDLRRLGTLVSAGPLAVPAAAAAVSATAPAVAGTGPPGGDFDRQVQTRLLALPSLSADDPRSRTVAPDPGLIRLPRPNDTARLPAFQFGPSGAPWPVVREINELLDAAGDPWGVACWWADPHERLGAAPADLLGLDKDDLLRLAARAVGEDY